jgi:hypothetical protein
VLYYRHNRKKEAIEMNNDVKYYVSKLTGEMVETHREAMELYRAGHDIECWGWSPTLGEMVNRVDWVH